jgi:hypothetical protein
MSVQTAYPDTPVVGFNGMLAQQFSLRQVDSGLVETGPTVLGQAVSPGTLDGQYINAVADGVVSGVAIYQGASEFPTAQYLDKEAFPVLSKGRYWATANGALAVGAVIAYDPATFKVGAVVGATTTLAFGKAITSSAADTDLIIVEVDF